MERLFSAVEIEINSACNRSCSYCPNSLGRRAPDAEISSELFSSLMSELQELKYSGRVSYSFYNEPLVHSKLEEIVLETRRCLPKARIELYTNGTLLTRDRFDCLRSAGVDSFIVTRQEQDTARHYPFAEVYACLSEQERMCVLFRSFSDINLTNRGGLLPHLGAGALPLAPCYIPAGIVTITVEGNVLPCFEDFHERLVMGNLRESTLLKIWNSEKYRLFRNALKLGRRDLQEPCRNCNRREALPPLTSEGVDVRY